MSKTDVWKATIVARGCYCIFISCLFFKFKV